MLIYLVGVAWAETVVPYFQAVAVLLRMTAACRERSAAVIMLNIAKKR